LGEKYGGWISSDVVEDTSVQSAPTFESSGSGEEEIAIDKDVLAKYINMRNEMKNLEDAIEKAAEVEDYDKAAELEERAQTVRDEFEAAGFMTEKFETALKDFTEKTSGSSNTAATDNPVDSEESSEKLIDEWLLDKYASLCADIEEMETNIESAVAEDEFDKAAELEEKLVSARSDIESLGFSVDELENALKNRSGKVAVEEDVQTEEGASSNVDVDSIQEDGKEVEKEDPISDNGVDNEEECADDVADDVADNDADNDAKESTDDGDVVKMNGDSTEESNGDAVDNTDGADEDG